MLQSSCTAELQRRRFDVMVSQCVMTTSGLGLMCPSTELACAFM